MTQKIIDALAKLDVTNDNHWTADGAPRIEALRILAGDGTIGRDDINKVDNNVTRDALRATIAATKVSATALPDGPEIAKVPTPEPAAPVAEPLAQLSKAEVLQRQDPVERVEARGEVDQDALDTLNAQLEELYQAKGDVETQIGLLSKDRDYLVARLAVNGPTEEQRSQVAIQHYLAAQMQHSQDRADAINGAPKRVETRSPLDAMLSSRGRNNAVR